MYDVKIIQHKIFWTYFCEVRFTIAYTVLFLYVMSAIGFWGYSLQKKSEDIFKLEIEIAESKKDEVTGITYDQAIFEATDKRRRRRMQYWGEGATFLVVILISAYFVYRAFHKQIQLTKLQRNFMMSVTHELKTPLASVILNLQTMLRRKMPPETQEKLLKSSEREAKRLSSLCNNIVVSTQLEDAGKNLYQTECDLSEMAMQSAEDFMETIEHRELKVDSALEKSVKIKGDAALWRLVISNLLQNAHKYSPIENEIELKIFMDGGKPKLQVSDFGIGVSEEEKKLIFDKFYRIGNENTRKSQGTGIGLYLVKKVVQLFKYDISVRNNEPQGSIFEIVFR